MGFESDITTDAFEVFAVPCTLAGDASSCILDLGIEAIDEQSGLTRRIDRATFLRSTVTSPTHGAALVVDGVTYTLGARLSDDGHAVAFEVHRA